MDSKWICKKNQIGTASKKHSPISIKSSKRLKSSWNISTTPSIKIKQEISHSPSKEDGPASCAIETSDTSKANSAKPSLPACFQSESPPESEATTNNSKQVNNTNKFSSAIPQTTEAKESDPYDPTQPTIQNSSFKVEFNDLK